MDNISEWHKIYNRRESEHAVRIIADDGEAIAEISNESTQPFSSKNHILTLSEECLRTILAEAKTAQQGSRSKKRT